MTHLVRIERRTLEGIIASIFGGSLVTAIAQRSWIGGIIAVVSGVLLLVIDWADIRDEESEK